MLQHIVGIVLLLVIVVNVPLMCLICKLTFIMCMYVCIGKNTVYIAFCTTHSFRHPLEICTTYSQAQSFKMFSLHTLLFLFVNNHVIVEGLVLLKTFSWKQPSYADLEQILHSVWYGRGNGILGVAAVKCSG